MSVCCRFLFFFNDTATTEIYTLSLHDALPISLGPATNRAAPAGTGHQCAPGRRSEEHTSELQSHVNLVCRLLLEKKKQNNKVSLHDLLHLLHHFVVRPDPTPPILPPFQLLLTN